MGKAYPIMIGCRIVLFAVMLLHVSCSHCPQAIDSKTSSLVELSRKIRTTQDRGESGRLYMKLMERLKDEDIKPFLTITTHDMTELEPKLEEEVLDEFENSLFDAYSMLIHVSYEAYSSTNLGHSPPMFHTLVVYWASKPEVSSRELDEAIKSYFANAMSKE